jgi:hypothetical protein
MITIKVTLSNGNNWTTNFNGSFDDAKHYYLDTIFESSDEKEYVCTNVEWIKLEQQ